MGAERRFATALRDAGVAIVWDNDDDLVRVRPQVNSQYSVASEQAHRELSAMMRLADAVTTTSPELARRFRRIDQRRRQGDRQLHRARGAPACRVLQRDAAGS